MDIKEKVLRSWDGTYLTVYDVGGAQDVAILCNGLGGDIRAWRPILDKFQTKIRFISWDYRGLYKSERPKKKNYKIEHHARDLEVIIEHFGVKKAVFFGWSMGVQLCLEFYRNHSDIFRAMVLINGVAGKPFEKAFNGRIPNFVWQIFFHFMKDGFRMFFPAARILAKRSVILKLASSIGVFTMSEYRDVARELVLAWLSLDMKEYVKNFRELGKHNAEDVLEKIKCPALVIYGTRDLFTPERFALEMAHKIKDAEVFEVENGSHYTPLEFPDKINPEIERFLKKHGIIQ
ncbi:MAG: alpha/beta hydrolase [Candidatus Calescibacterium sp.]|nr:alpha/beta hydrolase [Candidatus Calescibacterium sp.]MDW8086746.1 alpha/beta hydrolase [Candidatus Calescibacterium sp.]